VKRERDYWGIATSSVISTGTTLAIGAVMALLLQNSYGWVRSHFFPAIPELSFWPALGFMVCPRWILSRK
jgi:hypothetical protein